MGRHGENALPPPHAEPDERLPKPNETVDSDPKNAPAQPNADPEPVDRPDLDWAEHED